MAPKSKSSSIFSLLLKRHLRGLFYQPKRSIEIFKNHEMPIFVKMGVQSTTLLIITTALLSRSSWDGYRPTVEVISSFKYSSLDNG